jgi:hypothetical protein
MSKLRFLQVALGCGLLALTLEATLAAPATGSTEQRVVVEELLRASGVTASDLAAKTDRVVETIDSIGRKFRRGSTSYHRAWRLHRYLHKHHFRSYVPYADGLDRIVDNGEFSCVSSTIFAALTARAMGYEPVVVEFPGHLGLALPIDGRLVYVESTQRNGFDARPQTFREPVAWGDPASFSGPHLPGIDRDGPTPPGQLRVFSPEEAIGFVWLNSARRALDSGEAERAARRAARARRFLPDELALSDGVHRLVGHAFRSLYESREFDTAYRVALTEVELFPGFTTSHDRLVAAAYKRIETACESDDPSAAEALLDEVGNSALYAEELRRLELNVAPMITAAAVRTGEWTLAARTVERYSRAEPDEIEAARLREWVERRIRMAAGDRGPHVGL